MLTNALLAGAFGAAYLTIIVLQLNPGVPLVSATPWRWFVTLGLSYGVHFAVVFYVALVAREFFTMNVISPGWISVRLLAWLGAVLAAGAAGLMWLNVNGLSATLDDTAEWRMRAGAVAATASALVLLAIAVAHYSFGRRGSRVGASLFVIAAVASMALPLAARGMGTAAPRPQGRPAAGDGLPVTATAGPRLILLALDGASLEYVWPRAAEGRLPNFSRILDGGAVMDLATIRPTQPGPVWAAVASGMYPATNGIRSPARYYAGRDSRGVDLLPDHALAHVLVSLGFVRDQPLTVDQWGARPLWGILSDAGMSSGIVRWPLTHPAPPVAGFVVSDQLHQVTGTIREFERAAFPPAVLSTVQSRSSAALTGAAQLAVGSFAEGSREAAALRRDALYSRVAHALRAEHDPRLFAVRYEGLDTIGHYYLQYAQPEPADDLPEHERRRRAGVVDRYYAFIDAEIGHALESMVPGDLLLVISGFGMEQVNPVKKAIDRLVRGPVFTRAHDRAPDGFLLAFGNTVRPGRPQRGSIVDITPSVLYFFGLPVARDMDGYARADLFTAEFSAERPITFIPSYRTR